MSHTNVRSTAYLASTAEAEECAFGKVETGRGVGGQRCATVSPGAFMSTVCARHPQIESATDDRTGTLKRPCGVADEVSLLFRSARAPLDISAILIIVVQKDGLQAETAQGRATQL